MKLVVFGANGPTGRHVTEQALAEGPQGHRHHTSVRELPAE